MVIHVRLNIIIGFENELFKNSFSVSLSEKFKLRRNLKYFIRVIYNFYICSENVFRLWKRKYSEAIIVVTNRIFCFRKLSVQNGRESSKSSGWQRKRLPGQLPRSNNRKSEKTLLFKHNNNNNHSCLMSSNI